MSFKYETLEKATDYFNPSRKIGQGGAGSVYKGTLPDGRSVAVKRLIFNTNQWVDDFFNEVNLIAGIQHKNLVQLLGCSIEGPESLLVYEYVPKRSLDLFIFGNSSFFYVLHLVSLSLLLKLVILPECVKYIFAIENISLQTRTKFRL